MNKEDFAKEKFATAKTWAIERINEGRSWEEIALLCVAADMVSDELERLQEEELIIPDGVTVQDWRAYVDYLRSIIVACGPVGFDNNEFTSLPVPSGAGSAWVRYKDRLRGVTTGKRKMSDTAVDVLENNCLWMMNHLKRDTRTSGPVKGLVMGSVQSGKTANMIGLSTMAADYDWNLFIVLSGTIDNLRKQTRDRFFSDLTESGGVKWHVLDYTRNADYMLDIESGNHVLAENLHLNSFQNEKVIGSWLNRYVIVCLKNATRLKNLIKWLHAKPAAAAKLRIVIIDDEADQASVNAVTMDMTNPDEIERARVNQLIINLVKNQDEEGNPSKAPFQAVNYISFTATPYANVLNEAFEDSLYPHNFICSLPESDEYFGPRVIWGSKNDERYDGLNIVRTIPDTEKKDVAALNKGTAATLPKSMKTAVAWFLCASAVLRKRGHKKPISMLVHTTSVLNGHFEEYELIKKWLENASLNQVLELCETVYNEEKNQFRLADLRAGYPDYGAMDSVCDDFPEFSDIRAEISCILSSVTAIEMGEEKELHYKADAVHLCVDNCRARRYADEGEYLRIVYPTAEQLANLEKAPVFIVMGGNTLSRGLTFDFDVNLEIQRVFQDNLSPKAFKNRIKRALDGIVAATDYDFTEDSTRVLTIKVKDRENARILYSVDFAITRVSEDEDGDEFEEFIRFNKERDSYQWCRQEERYYRLMEKAKWLKENELWQELRDYYLKKKNENENPQLHSRSIYDIAVHEMCQKNGYFEQEAPRANAGALTTEPIQQHREIQSSFSLYGQNAVYGIHPTFKAVKCTDLLNGNALPYCTE